MAVIFLYSIKANLQLDVEIEIVYVDHLKQLGTEEKAEQYDIWVYPSHYF